MTRPRLLFLKSGPFFIPEDIPNQGKYRLFSRRFTGEIVAIVHQKKYVRSRIGRFLFRGLYLPTRARYSSLKCIPYSLFVILTSVYRHYTKKKYDAVVAYDPFLTGINAFMISRLTGAKLIVEMNGNYGHALNLNHEGSRAARWLKSRLMRWMVPFILNRAHGTKILYDDQLAPFDKVRNRKSVHRFHNHVPIGQFRADQPRGNYILFMGFPWYLKGVDILIKAFLKVADQHPGYHLVIVGHCPDMSPFQALAGGHARISLRGPVWYDEAMRLMEQCSFFVLPSRTDALARVLYEAMASRRAIVASAVDGIPSYITDGYNGLLFRPGDHEDLARKLDLLMSRPDLVEAIAANGKSFVHARMSEDAYLEKYCEFIECSRRGHKVCGG